MTHVSHIPVAKTPTGGYGSRMPKLILEGCSTDIDSDVPDFRGLWRPVRIAINGIDAEPDNRLWNHLERIEQAGRRVVITSDGIIHDMVADGTFENGVNDVAAIDFTTPIVVAASFEDGELVLRPKGLEGIEVRRRLDGPHLVWNYANAFEMTLEKSTESPER